MSEKLELKRTIQDEMDRVTKLLIQGGENDHTRHALFKEWLQSLQRINDVCKERNRY